MSNKMKDYANMDDGKLKKEQTRLQKSTKKAPDEKAHKDMKQKLERAINDRKLASAQKQFELESKKNELKRAREQFQLVLGIQQEAQKNLKEHKEYKEMAKDKLSKKFSGRKIRDPTQRKKEVIQEIRDLRLELQTGNQNQRGETRIIRSIKQREAELEKIKEYIQNDVSSVFKKYEEHSKNFNEVFQDFSQKRQSTDKASLHRKKLKEETDRITQEKKDISEEIIELAKQKRDLNRNFQDQLRSYEDNMKALAELQQFLNFKSTQKVTRQANAEHAKKAKKEADEKKKKAVEKEQKEQAELAERKEASEKKRQKAIEAYRAMQAKLKARTVSTSTGGSVSGGSRKKAATVVDDPHSAEKDLCRNLIVLCESMVPPARKKKKKNVRLVYRADSFAKFNQVGVKIPKYSKQLAETIKALEERIVSYDEEPQTEEVTEKEEEQQEEAPVVEEPAETTESQI